MSKLLLGISTWSGIVAGLIALLFANIYDFTWYENIWFWVFAIPAIPAATHIVGLFQYFSGTVLLQPFIGLQQLDEEFAPEELHDEQ